MQTDEAFTVNGRKHLHTHTHTHTHTIAANTIEILDIFRMQNLDVLRQP